MSQQSIWAAWTADNIWLYLQQSDSHEIVVVKLPQQIPADYRYFLRLFRLQDGSILLRSGDSNSTNLHRLTDKQHFQPLDELPPELAALPCYQVKPLQDGTIIGINPSAFQLILWKPDTFLHLIEAPPGFQIRDTDLDTKGHLWICGSAPANKLKTIYNRPAIAVTDTDQIAWQITDHAIGRLGIAWKQLLYADPTSYRTIRVLNNYIVLSAEIDEIDHRSTLLFVRYPNQRWQSNVLHNDVIRTVLPEARGGVNIITHYGQSIVINKQWKYFSLAQQLDILIRDTIMLPEYARYEIIDAQSMNGEITLVVSVRIVTENNLSRFGEAVMTLGRGNDYKMTFHTHEQPEVISASMF